MNRLNRNDLHFAVKDRVEKWLICSVDENQRLNIIIVPGMEEIPFRLWNRKRQQSCVKKALKKNSFS